MFIIRQLFKQEIRKKYHSQLGRYLIYRDKKSFWRDQKPESRIPYQYLLQLSLKHLKGNILVSEAYREGLRHDSGKPGMGHVCGDQEVSLTG